MLRFTWSDQDDLNAPVPLSYPLSGEGGRCEGQGSLPNCDPVAQAPHEDSWRSHHSNKVEPADCSATGRGCLGYPSPESSGLF